MPMVAAAAGAAISWVGGAAASAGALAATSLSVATGMSIGTAMAITSTAGSLALNAGLAAAASVLMQPKVGAGGSPTAFKADPAAPISGVMGRFGVGGRQLHGNVWGKGNLYLSFATALSLGPISGIAEFKANDTVVTFPGPQGLAAAVEPYKDKMWMTYRLGLPSDTALQPPSGVSDGSPSMSEWTTSHTTPGLAAGFWTLKNNSKHAGYEGGVPRPLWTLLGMLVWDPRLDSTYPGGSGSQRRDDWTTWGYSENPFLHALAWVRGHFKTETDGSIDRSIRLAGIGAPDAAIDIGSFVEGANVADANEWKISGEWTTSDDKWQTLAAMLQAGGGVPLNRGAMIGCMVNAPRTSILTLTHEDIVGPVRIGVMASRRDRPNTIIPRYRSEPHKWEEVPAGAVSAETYVTEDRGETRTREVSYRYVRQAKQAAELAAYDLANARETLTPSIPSKPYMLGLRAGDAFTIEAPETGMNGQKVVLMRRPFDPASAIVTLEWRSETDAKHAWALGQSANPPDSPSLTAIDAAPVEATAIAWEAAKKYEDGSSRPVAGEPITVTAEDGEDVTFTPPFAVPPLVIPTRANFEALGAGETYLDTPLSLTGDGFVAQARIVTPGSSPVYTVRTDGSATDMGSGLAWEMQKALSGVAYDRVYTADFSVYIIGDGPVSVPGSLTRSMTVGLYGRRGGGAWYLMGTQSFTSTYDADLNEPSNTDRSSSIAGTIEWTDWDTDGATEYRLEVISGGLAGKRYISAWSAVTWNEQTGGSAASDRSALPSGQTTTFLVIAQGG